MRAASLLSSSRNSGKKGGGRVDGGGGGAIEKKDGYYIEWLVRRNGGVLFKSRMHLEREWDGELGAEESTRRKGWGKG